MFLAMQPGTAMATINSSSAESGTSAVAQVEARVRDVLSAHAQLQGVIDSLAGSTSLYEHGMTSRASVTVMLALEGEFEIEFPDAMLRRDVFESLDAITRAVCELLAGR